MEMKLTAWLQENTDELLEWLQRLDGLFAVGDVTAPRRTRTGNSTVTIQGLRMRKDSREYRPWKDIHADLDALTQALAESNLRDNPTDEEGWVAWGREVHARRVRRMELYREAGHAAPAELYMRLCYELAGAEEQKAADWLVECEKHAAIRAGWRELQAEGKTNA